MPHYQGALPFARASSRYVSTPHFQGAAILYICLALLLVPSALNAATIGFDDIDASAGDVVLDALNPYQGYNWTNFTVYTSTPGFPGYNNGIVSSPNAAYTSGDALGSPIVSTVTAASGSFDFVNAYLGSGWYNGLSVTLQGLSGRVQDFSQTVTVNTTGAQLFTFDFADIDALRIFSTVTPTTSDPYGCGPSGCSQVTVDDITLTPSSGPPPPPPPPPPTVPEPASLALAALALSALAAFRVASSRKR